MGADRLPCAICGELEPEPECYEMCRLSDQLRRLLEAYHADGSEDDRPTLPGNLPTCIYCQGEINHIDNLVNDLRDPRLVESRQRDIKATVKAFLPEIDTEALIADSHPRIPEYIAESRSKRAG